MLKLSDFLPTFSSSKKKILGVDIGTASIKAVELSSSKKGVSISNYGILEAKSHLERVNNAIQTSSLEVMDSETVKALKTLVSSMNTSTKDVMASLPSFSAFTSLIDLPEMAPEETSQAMEYQAKALVPMPISQITLDWVKIATYKNESGTDTQKVLLIAVPTKQIKKYQSIFQQAGLSLSVLELETVSLARALTTNDQTLSLIIDIGARSTAFAVAKNGFLRHSAQADFAGSSLTHALAKGLSINIMRAESLKRQKGLLGKGGEYEVSTLMVPYLDVIINEAKRVKEGYERNHNEKIERVVVSGGGAGLLGIEEYITKSLKMPAVKADPLGSRILYPQAAAPTLKSAAPALSVAIGLGIRALNIK